MKKPNNPIAAVDMGIFRFDGERLSVFLVELLHGSFRGRLALPGARLAAEESMEDAALRVYREAGGDTPCFIEQVYTFSAVDRDPRSRAIATAYMAFPPDGCPPFQPCSKYARGAWYDVFTVRDLAYDHEQISRVCRQRIAAKLNYTTIALLLLPEEFTLTEMQTLYELCSGEQFDKRNFRKKIKSMNIIVETGRQRSGRKARPAMLYRAKRRSMELVSLFR